MKVKRMMFLMLLVLFCAPLSLYGADMPPGGADNALTGTDYAFIKVDGKSGASTRYIYYPNGVRWNMSVIPWKYNPKGQLVSTDTALKAIKAAMKSWETVSGIRFIYRGLTDQPLINDQGDGLLIGWLDAETFVSRFGDYGAYGSIWYQGDYLSSGEISLNSGFTRYGTYSLLQGIVTHEVGHILGLDHSDVNESVMFANPYHDEDYMQTLRKDDIAGVDFLYPVSQARRFSQGVLTLPRVWVDFSDNNVVDLSLALGTDGLWTAQGVTLDRPQVDGISATFKNSVLSVPVIDAYVSSGGSVKVTDAVFTYSGGALALTDYKIE